MKILLVDDDELLRDLLQMHLELDGHDVLQAADGAAALDLLGREACDAVVLDLMMPGMDGLRFVRGLEQIGRTPAVVVLSSLDRREIRAELEAAGVRAVLRKPVDPAELIRMISDVVAAA